jgi:hypothetical protein
MYEKVRAAGRDIQEGLHALTGRDAEVETRYRAEILLRTPIRSMEFGLGIHAYGDSFAHRQMNGDGKMYIGPRGHLDHAIEEDPKADLTRCNDYLNAPNLWGLTGDPTSAAFASLGSQFSETYVHDPHEPDFINKRLELYVRYAKGHYEILEKKLPDAARRMEIKDLAPKLVEVAKLGDEPAQIVRLRAIAAERPIGIPMAAYAPEDEGRKGPLTWPEYMINHQLSTPVVGTQDLVKAQITAHQWANTQP